MPKLTFLPPMLSGGRPETRFSTSSPSVLLYTGSQQTAHVATTETLNLQSYLQRQTLIPDQYGSAKRHISLQDCDLCFQWLNLLLIKGQNVTANWCLQSELKKSHFHRTIRMGRCFLWRATHHCDIEKSAVHPFLNRFQHQEDPANGRGGDFSPEERVLH